MNAKEHCELLAFLLKHPPKCLSFTLWRITEDGQKKYEVQEFIKEGNLWGGARAKSDYYREWSSLTPKIKENKYKLEGGTSKTKERKHQVPQGKGGLAHEFGPILHGS